MIQPKLRQREYTWMKTYLVVLYIKILSNQNIVEYIAMELDIYQIELWKHVYSV